MADSFQSFGECMPGGFFVYHADEKEELIYANDVMLDIFGCQTIDELKELTGFTFQGLVYPEDLEKVQNSIDIQVESHSKKLDYVEYRIKRKDGALRWVDDYGRLVHTEEYGDVYYVLIRDITDLHNMRDENHRRAAVISGLSADYSCIYLLNPENGHIRSYRSEDKRLHAVETSLYQDITGVMDYKKVLTAYDEQYLYTEDHAYFQREISLRRITKQLDKYTNYTVNYRCRDKTGRLHYSQMSVARVDGDDLEGYIVLAFRDISNQLFR